MVHVKKEAVAEPKLDDDTPWVDPRHPRAVGRHGERPRESRDRRDVSRFENGIPLLFATTDAQTNGHDVTDIVKQFYEKTPFPNYEDLDSVRALLEKGAARDVCPPVERADSRTTAAFSKWVAAPAS